MVKAVFIVSRNGSGLRPVFGVPVARRLVLVARGLGLDAIHVLGRDDALRRVLSDLIPAHAFHTPSDVRELSGMAGMLGLGDADQVLVMRADHVIDRWSLGQLLERGVGSDSRICVATAGELASVLQAVWSPGEPATTAGGREEVDAEEAVLLDALGRATHATDSLLSRHIHRPISRFITKRLARTAATPNMVTLFTIMVGLAGAFFLAQGAYAPQVLGSLLFLSSTILDGVDGEMARLKLKETVLGHYLDIVGDNVVHVAVFFGIAFGLYRHTADPVYLHALWFLLCGFAFCALAVQRVMGHGPEKHGSGEAPWLAALLVNRDFAYVVVALALLHRLSWFLIAAAAGTYVVALTLFAISFKKRPTASV